ncbi:MAG: hypothetical protein Q9220_002311 [cf. Caloplaca sp. 1 TL-2023]
MAFMPKVIVKLIPRNNCNDFTRTLSLDLAVPSADVGRASKVASKGLLASSKNAWFDSPIMSRQHGKITMTSTGAVSLQDCGSTHGTWLRNKRLASKETRIVDDGDVVTFGSTVTSGPATYHARTFELEITTVLPRQENAKSGFHVPDDVSDSSSDRSKASSCQLVKSRPRTFSVPSSGDELEETDDEDPVADRSQRRYLARQRRSTGSQGNSAIDPIEVEETSSSRVNRIIYDSEDEEPVPVHPTTPADGMAVTSDPGVQVPDTYPMPVQCSDEPQGSREERTEQSLSPSPDISHDEEEDVGQGEDTCSESGSMEVVDTASYDEGSNAKTGDGASKSLHLPPAPLKYPFFLPHQPYAPAEAQVQEPASWTQDTPSIDATHNHHIWSEEPAGAGLTCEDRQYISSVGYQSPPMQAGCSQGFLMADTFERGDRLEMAPVGVTHAQATSQRTYPTEEPFKIASPGLCTTSYDNSASQKASGLASKKYWQMDTEAVPDLKLSAARPPSPSDAALARKATLAGSQHCKPMDTTHHVDEPLTLQAILGNRDRAGPCQASYNEPSVSLPTSRFFKESAMSRDPFEHQLNTFLPPYNARDFEDWDGGSEDYLDIQQYERFGYPQGPFSRRYQARPASITRSPSYEPPSPEKSCLVRLKLDQQNTSGRSAGFVNSAKPSKVDISNLVNTQAESSRGLKRKLNDISTNDPVDATVSQINAVQFGMPGTPDELLSDAQPRDPAPIIESLSTQGTTDDMLQPRGNTATQACHGEPARKRSKLSNPKASTMGKFISGVCLGLAGAFAALIAATPRDVWEEALREAANV